MADASINDSLLFNRSAPWQERLDYIMAVMREMSAQTDPQEMVAAYARHMRRAFATDRSISLSRRDLRAPLYRITRSDLIPGNPNPWKDKSKLPLFDRGKLGDLLYGGQAVVENELNVSPDDPAYAYFAGMKSLVAIPLFDGGVALNMVVMLRRDIGTYPQERLPEHVWMSNLFGRATQNLVLSEEVRKSYEIADRELKTVAEIQRSLLPTTLPDIPGLDLAAHYQTSRQSGGDYYDLFPLKDGRWGIFIGDVSGKGTGAAVLMAVTHSIAHALPDSQEPPSHLMRYVNDRLAARYTNGNGMFVTAFYGIYDPRNRTLIYSSAGHCPSRLRRCSKKTVDSLEAAGGLPLGIDCEAEYTDATIQLHSGDTLVLYTDGITEARGTDSLNPTELYGTERLDEALSSCLPNPTAMIEHVLSSVEHFTDYAPASDDRTLLVARVK